MSSKKLEKALALTNEEQADAFERFANAFLVDDYPALEPLGGKKDKGMDARVILDETGKNLLVVQSCVSPSNKARNKILKTVEKIQSNLPPVFVYCTSATIGLRLDETKRELFRDQKVTLEVRDSAWFCTRCLTSSNRISLSETYTREVLEPFLRELDPNRLYSAVLNEEEERTAVHYLEAMNLDRSRGSNMTKGLFDALIVCVTRDSDPGSKAYSEENIFSTICAIFLCARGTGCWRKKASISSALAEEEKPEQQ